MDVVPATRTPRWTIGGLRRGLDRSGGSLVHARRLFRSPRPRDQIFGTPVGDRFNGEGLVGGDAVTPRTIGHRNLAIKHFGKTRHTDPKWRFAIALCDRPERLCIRHTVFLRLLMGECYEPCTLDNIRSISSAKDSNGNAPG